MAVEAASVWTRAPGIAASKLGDELVVLDSEGRMLRGLNLTGQRVFELVDGRRSVEEISEALAQETGEASARVLPDVVAFVRALADRRLLVEVSRQP